VGSRRLRQEFKAVLHRINTALVGDFVHKRFGRELVGGEPDPAERRSANASVLVDLLHQLMRNVIPLGVGPQHQDEVLVAGLFIAHWINEWRHAISHKPMLPRHELARTIKARPQIMCRERPKASIMDVVLARPHRLYWLAHRLGEQDGID
jgi:hypothetical protein